MKKALFIGGTGTISMAVTRLVASSPDWQLYLLNRGNRTDNLPENIIKIKADVNNEADLAAKLKDLSFDCVCDFIGFIPESVERDCRIFKGKTKQYIYISSASAYQKPVENYLISEDTPLENPYWQYSRDKKACEEFLMGKYKEEGFPVTIVRPTYTYDERSVPLGVVGKNGSWQVLKRMLEGKPVIIHGDGTSLWTMTHNSDFAKGFFGLMGNSGAIGNAFHITSDETLTWTQIYQCVAKALGVELKPYYVASSYLAEVGPDYDLTGSLLGDKACSVVFDLSKLKKAVPDYSPSVSFEEGIRRTVENILAHPELQKEDPEFDNWCDKVIGALENSKSAVLWTDATESRIVQLT